MHRSLPPISSAVLLLFLATCGANTQDGSSTVAASANDFNSYWYDGHAELNHYELQQARYGEVHPGSAVLIFVTEDLLVNEQVKYEGEGNAQHTSVLKLNAVREFNTGIYRYTMMNSVFTPVKTSEFPHTLKTTSSSLDWCGQSFLQLNNRNGGYVIKQFSYFQDEGDKEFTTPVVWMEDEIWNRLRIDPKGLPKGELEMIPGANFLRLKHVEPLAYKAMVEVGNITRGGKDQLQIKVSYPELDRQLTIWADASFPYVVQGWEEEYMSGSGMNANKLKTTATLTHTQKRKYWAENEVSDAHLRKEFGFTY